MTRSSAGSPGSPRTRIASARDHREDRRRDVAPVGLPVRLVDEDADDDPRPVGREEAVERRDVAVVRVAGPGDRLLRRPGLPRDGEPGHGRLAARPRLDDLHEEPAHRGGRAARRSRACRAAGASTLGRRAGPRDLGDEVAASGGCRRSRSRRRRARAAARSRRSPGRRTSSGARGRSRTRGRAGGRRSRPRGRRPSSGRSRRRGPPGGSSPSRGRAPMCAAPMFEEWARTSTSGQGAPRGPAVLVDRRPPDRQRARLRSR